MNRQVRVIFVAVVLALVGTACSVDPVPEINLSAPNNLRARLLPQYSGFELAWDGVANANAYTVYISSAPDGTFVEWPTSSTSMLFAHKTNNQSFYVKVMAKASGKYSPESEVKQVDLPYWPLYLGELNVYELSSKQDLWFTFSANQGVTYELTWEDSLEPTPTYLTADVMVSVKNLNTNVEIQAPKDSGKTTPVSLVFAKPTELLIHVQGKSQGTTGSFALKLTSPTRSVETIDKVASSGTFQYTLNLDEEGSSVYFIFTNTNPTKSTSLPLVNGSQARGRTLEPSPRRGLQLNSSDQFMEKLRQSERDLLKDLRTNSSRSTRSMETPPPTVETVGTSTFNYKSPYETPSSTKVTLRAQIPNITTGQGLRTLKVWVADNCWGSGSSKAFKVSQTMVDALAGQFLKTGADNDIYDWVTGIYGPEWGPTDDDDLIPFNQTIDIVLYDLLGDNSTNGGLLGYYWAGNNIETSLVPGSNRRIMFALDAVLFATSNNWSVHDFWPSMIISTLAHEFQHMIQFYQKAVLGDNYGLDTWLNEMLSMATEDLVADKIQSNGPRGVNFGDYTAGSPGNREGRLPLFSLYNDDNPTTWLEGPQVYRSYSTSYAFGAWLMRNYIGNGSKNLLQEIQSKDNPKIDYQAVTWAIKSTTGTVPSFKDLLKNWGAAALLSDRIMAEPYSYNSGGAFTYSANGLDYNLGSINLYNYTQDGGPSENNGPYVYTDPQVGYTATLPGFSNTYFKAGAGLKGNQTWHITLPPGVEMTAVVK